MTRAAIRRTAGLLVFGALGVSAIAGSAPAAPASADLEIRVIVSTSRNPNSYADGQTVTVNSLNFFGGALLANNGPEVAKGRIRFELPAGLGWGEDGPDPTEDCSVSQTPVCQSLPLDANVQAQQDVAWDWNIAAASAGSYVLKASIVDASTSDANAANNSAAVTVLVAPSSTGGSAGGGGSASAAASAVRLTPLRPKAGSAVTATVRVTSGGISVRPTRVSCTGVLGNGRLVGAPKAGIGTATCTYRPPRTARGKTLKGSVSLTAGTTRLTRRFSTRLS